VRVDPLCEGAHRMVMRLYAATSQSSAALRHYDQLTELLRQELDTVPSAATRALAREIAQAAADDGQARPDSKVLTAECGKAGEWASGRAKDQVGLTSSPAPSLPHSPSLPPSVPLEPVGGAVPLGSRFYVARSTDHEFREAVERGDSVVLVKGARQVGKTSLLARGLQQAREAGAQVIFTDFQLLSDSHLVSADALFRVLGASIAEQLELEVQPSQVWDEGSGPGL